MLKACFHIKSEKKAVFDLERKEAGKCCSGWLETGAEGSGGVTVVSVHPVFRALVARLPRGQVPRSVTVVRAPHCADILEADQ